MKDGLRAYVLLLLIVVFVFIGIFTLLGRPALSPFINDVQHQTLYFYGMNISIGSGNYLDSDGLTSAKKLEFIRVALNDPMVKELVIRPNASTTIGNVSRMESDTSPAYINYNTTDASFYINLQVVGNVDNMTAITDIEHIFVAMNISRDTIDYVDVGNFRAEPLKSSVTIPPNASWYCILSGWSGAYYINMTYTPDDIPVYPMVINWTDFNDYVNSKPVKPYMYTISGTNKTIYYDGSKPVVSGKPIGVLFGGPFDKSKVLILKNGDSHRPVKIIISSYDDYSSFNSQDT